MSLPPLGPFEGKYQSVYIEYIDHHETAQAFSFIDDNLSVEPLRVTNRIDSIAIIW
jgi:hypothetical protein